MRPYIIVIALLVAIAPTLGAVVTENYEGDGSLCPNGYPEYLVFTTVTSDGPGVTDYVVPFTIKGEIPADEYGNQEDGQHRIFSFVDEDYVLTVNGVTTGGIDGLREAWTSQFIATGVPNRELVQAGDNVIEMRFRGPTNVPTGEVVAQIAATGCDVPAQVPEFSTWAMLFTSAVAVTGGVLHKRHKE